MDGKPLSLVWLRRDLRLHDHAALAHALKAPGNVQPVFVFDTDILARFTNPQDRRLSFIADALCRIHKECGGLLVLHGKAGEVIPKAAAALGAAQVVAAEDYEPDTRRRDALVHVTLVKDHVVFSPTEILREGASPYKVFTPYSKIWFSKLDPSVYAPYEVDITGRMADIVEVRKRCVAAGLAVLAPEQGAAAMLAAIGYKHVQLPLWPVAGAGERMAAFADKKIRNYPTGRDLVGEEGTSRISPYLRFGLVSVRECLRLALEAGQGEKWVSELAWRDFYAMILYHWPESAAQEWNPRYRGLEWSHDADLFAAWKAGKTGYPMVDAAMRQLLQEGWMHNRARMVVASFMTKDLHLDWRLGEEHFAQELMDYDMASNVGGWQWAASTGTDAQPWFRIFNPLLQSRKFDPQGKYIRRYVPELAALSDDHVHEPWKAKRRLDYPEPVVNHASARETALAMFKKVAGQDS